MNQDAAIVEGTASKKVTRIRWIALIVLMIATVIGAFFYWRHSELYPSTENAYTASNIVRVAPEVKGAVASVYVNTADQVEVGDLLFDLDPAPYDIALRAARAQFDAAADSAGTAAEALKGAADKLDEQRLALEKAAKAYREANSRGDKDGDASSAEKAWRDALKAYEAAEQAFAAEQDKKLTVTTPTVQLRGAAAQLEKATRDSVKTHVVAPSGGVVSEVTLRPGATLQAGSPAFAIIESNRWWVNANFKETDLARIKTGQPATIALDMYPGVAFEGEVESISPGSGATFSVLPAENATGNWVKVTQRFPVRVRIVNAPEDRSLRVGASATVTVDTTQSGK